MEHLPTELRLKIVQYLDLPTLKCLRVTSKSWAELGEEYLISPTITTLPHRNDFTRLLAISQSPKYAHTIQSLFINMGEINEYHARHNSFYLQYMRDSDSRLAAQEESWGLYAKLKLLKEEFLPDCCTPEILNTAFKTMENLKSIDMSLTTCPFPEPECPELLQQIWNIPTTRLLPRVATTERFTSLLSAISLSPVVKLNHLSHDRLPFEFFAQNPMVTSLFSTVFIPLTSLSLTINYSEKPNNLYSAIAFQNLSDCLRCASALQTLNLSFQGRTKTTISPLLSSFIEHNFSFSSLEKLKFEGVISTEEELVEFLFGQKALKDLQLGGEGAKEPYQAANGGVHLREGSWQGLFAKVHKGMRERLDRFVVQGDLVGQESREEVILTDLTLVDMGLLMLMDVEID